jgi:ABC-type phosphate/phosphonate transport system substrate-binding protein
MYDRAETRGANDRLWALIRDALRDRGQSAPDHLSRPQDPWADWQSPDLILSQTCGLPYRTRLHDRVQLIATPVWDLPCPEGRYYSVLVAHRTDPRETLGDFGGARLAYNEPLSQSGWAAPATEAARSGITFGKLVRTGAHRASAQAVAKGRADLAAIDAVTWAMIGAWDTFSADLKIVGHTAPTPALPYISALQAEGDTVFAALETAIAALTPEDRACLHLTGVIRIPAADYLSVPTPSGPANPR